MLVDQNDPAYDAATRPHTSSVEQRPVRVAVITGPADIPVALEEVDALARFIDTSLRVMPQATGHGAGAIVDEGTVVLDTSGLTDVTIDPERRTAVVDAVDPFGRIDRSRLLIE